MTLRYNLIRSLNWYVRGNNRPVKYTSEDVWDYNPVSRNYKVINLWSACMHDVSFTGHEGQGEGLYLYTGKYSI